MKRSGARIGALMICVAFLLTGCGEKPIALTESEEDIIVHYAAHVVSKYNKRQPQGIVNVIPEAVTETEQEIVTPEEPTETEAEQAENPEPGTGTTPEETGYVSLNEALGISGLDVSFTGANLTASYTEEDYYAVDASAGMQYMVLHFTLTNTGAEAVACDMLAIQPVFKAEVNGSVQTTAKTTILLDDLSTYQGSVDAGASVETVLLFEVPADSMTSVDQVVLSVTRNGEKLSTQL